MGSKCFKSHRGIAIVEVACVLPVIALIAMATIDIASMIKVKQALVLGCYEGCRVGVVPESQDVNIDLQVREILDARSVSGYSISIQRVDEASLPNSERLTVQVSAPTNQNILFSGWLQGSANLEGSVTMIREKL